MTQPPEFSRPIRLDALGLEPRRHAFAADAGEREALARRFDLVAVEALDADAVLVRDGDAVVLSGTLRATVTQSCVASGVPLDARVEELFRIEFRPAPGADDTEVELSEAECDVIFHAGDAIDIGEAIAETLSLSLDPYPRAPDAGAALRAAGVKSEAEAGQFGALAALRDKFT